MSGGKNVIPAGELQAAHIKLATAKSKLEFLTKIAQAAHEAAERELSFERANFQRIEKLLEKQAISSGDFELARRYHSAAEYKVQLLETIPGVQPTNK